MLTKTKITLPVLLLLMLLAGCQIFPDTTTKIQETYNTAITEGAQKSQELKQTLDQKTTELKQTYEETKNKVDQKVQQFNEAGQKIQEAQKAFGEATDAVSNLTN